MASLEPGKYKGRRAPTGYSFRTGNSGRDVYTPVNPNNRSNRLKRNPGSMGGGRSNLDNQRGFSNQGRSFSNPIGIGNPFGPSSQRQPGLFGSKNTGGNRPNTYIDPRSRYASGISNTSVSDPREEFIMNRDVFEETPSGYDKEYKNIAFNLPSLKLMKGIGDGIQNIGRGSRLQGMYQDRAVADGRSKSSGYQDFKNDKMSMMTEKDRAFYDKYMNLSDMAQDNEKRDEYKKTAETAWRNQQTTDRLSMVSGFEDYLPDKYIDKRYTGSHPLAGQRVPGRGRMDEIAGNLGYDVFNPLPGSGRSMASGQDAIDSQMNYEDITESIVTDTEDSYPNRPPLFEEDFSQDVYSDRQPQLFGSRRDQLEPFEAQRQKATFFDRGTGPRGMGPDQTFFGGMEYPFGVDFDDTEDDLGPRGRFSLYDN